MGKDLLQTKLQQLLQNAHVKWPFGEKFNLDMKIFI